MRKARAKKRPLLPDPRFNDTLVTRFVNNLMLDGKKSIAFNIFYDAIDIVSEKTEGNGLETFERRHQCQSLDLLAQDTLP